MTCMCVSHVGFLSSKPFIVIRLRFIHLKVNKKRKIKKYMHIAAREKNMVHVNLLSRQKARQSTSNSHDIAT